MLAPPPPFMSSKNGGLTNINLKSTPFINQYLIKGTLPFYFLFILRTFKNSFRDYFTELTPLPESTFY